LNTTEERLRFALETSHTGAWDLDLVDHTAFRSLEHDRIFGYDRLFPEWTYEMFLEHVLPEDRMEVDAKFRRATADHSVWNFECRIRRKDGEVRWIWAAGRHVPDAAGGIRRMVGIVQDITERKWAEEQLRKAHDDLDQKVRERTEDLHKANRTLRMISECNQVLVRTADEAELIGQVCRIVVEIGGHRMAWVGYAEDNEEKSVRPVASVGIEQGYLKSARISWADGERGRGPTGACIRNGEVRLGRNFQTDPDLAPWRDEALKRGFQSSIALPLKSGSKAFGALTIYDDRPEGFDLEQVALLRELADDLAYGIVALRMQAERDQARQTAEKRAEQLQALAAELVRAEQKERRRLAQILHDHLQQLLVGAKFQAGVIGARASAADVRQDVQQLVETLDEAVRASRSLSADLSPPILHEKGLAAGLEWLGRQMHQKHGLMVEVETETAAEPIAEQVRLLLFEAVRELLLNVVKHALVDRAKVRLRTLQDGDLEVEVSDTGIGYNPLQVDTATPTTGGFGLFSIRERLGYLGGWMTIDAAPGRGSRFTLVAPSHPASAQVRIRPADAEVRPDAMPHTTAAIPRTSFEAGNRIRVLLADDHPLMRQGLTRLLQDLPDILVIGEAGDGQGAIDLARQLRPDVVLMDISMPRINGYEATRRILSACPSVRVIGLSMHEEPEVAASMYKVGAAAFVTKGGPTEHLIAAIRACRTQGRTPSENPVRLEGTPMAKPV
jgi:PAS domain S-box-containing protein